MSELAEGARLEIACTTNVVPRVRIPLSPPFTSSGVFRRLDGDVSIAPFIGYYKAATKRLLILVSSRIFWTLYYAI